MSLGMLAALLPVGIALVVVGVVVLLDCKDARAQKRRRRDSRLREIEWKLTDEARWREALRQDVKALYRRTESLEEYFEIEYKKPNDKFEHVDREELE